MPTITICTDAGHKNLYEQSLGVWACYIRTPSQTIRSSGVMKQHVKGSSQAELYAIANALHIVSRDYDLSKYRVIVYADNLWALGHTQGKCNQETSPVYRKYIRPHIRKAAIFEPRHVKAHLEPQKWSKRSARHYMQDWCDQEVHRLMKVATKERLALQSAIDLQKNKQKS